MKGLMNSGYLIVAHTQFKLSFMFNYSSISIFIENFSKISRHSLRCRHLHVLLSFPSARQFVSLTHCTAEHDSVMSIEIKPFSYRSISQMI